MYNFLNTWKDNIEYFNTLKMLASLSKLFSEGNVPYLDYRLAENIFCRYYKAENEARACTAYDAKIDNTGIGIKTFILKHNQSTEKVAEFNKLKPILNTFAGIELARKLGEYRNDRIVLADNMYGTTNRLYHIVGRGEGVLRIFNTSYDYVNIDNITIIKDDNRSLVFHDNYNEYFFNKSKSVLIKRFIVPDNNTIEIDVDIIDDPLTLLSNFFKNIPNNNSSLFSSNIVPEYIPGKDYVILPLYSTQAAIPTVPIKSGLNQWNAGGRKRDPNEVYIPIPRKIHQLYPDFFPARDEHFTLLLPNGQSLSAKVCQDGCKALMSTHNADLGKWILRTVLHKPEGELVTMDDFYKFGIDSVRIENKHKIDNEGKKVYAISFTSSDYESYSKFTEDVEV